MTIGGGPKSVAWLLYIPSLSKRDREEEGLSKARVYTRFALIIFL